MFVGCMIDIMDVSDIRCGRGEGRYVFSASFIHINLSDFYVRGLCGWRDVGG